MRVLKSKSFGGGPVTAVVTRPDWFSRVFDANEPRNNELIVEFGMRGQFPPSEQIDLGTHCDLIDHLWHTCNSQLECDCRWIVAFRPALVHPKTGVAFAIARGTNYFIRVVNPVRSQYAADLRSKALSDADKVGVEPDGLDHYLEMRSGDSDIGPSWACGWFLSNEADYIRNAYQDCG